MDDAARRFFVLTGGPGSGKTTLIETLREKGFATSREAGRRVIRAEAPIGGEALPSADRRLFAELMLFAELESLDAALAARGPVFFDRGIPDCLGYLDLCNLPVPKHFEGAAERFRYAPLVFLCPPWKAIFGQDAERRQDFAEASRTADAMRRVYGRLGYELRDVPFGTVEARCQFILDAARSVRNR